MTKKRLALAVTLSVSLAGVATLQEAAMADQRELVQSPRLLSLVSDANLEVLATADQNAFVDIPGMVAPIDVGPQRCVTAVFSSEVEGREIHFRALLDGELMQGHRSDISAVVHTTADGTANLVSYTFWACGVRHHHGLHTVRLQWSTPFPNVAVTARTLVVEGH